jgi:DNA-binding NarL/FixJ family response regulator
MAKIGQGGQRRVVHLHQEHHADGSPPATRTGVVVVDEHPVALRGTVGLLEELGYDVLAATSDPGALERLMADLPRPAAVLLIDPTAGDRGRALAVIDAHVHHRQACGVLAFSSELSPAQVETLLDLGCLGIVPKTAAPAALAEALAQVATGQRHLHPRAVAALLQRRQSGDVLHSIRPLSGRELAVLREVAEGRSNAQIAVVLGVTEATVKTHVAHVLRKLHAEDRAHAVSRALRLGLFE